MLGTFGRPLDASTIGRANGGNILAQAAQRRQSLAQRVSAGCANKRRESRRDGTTQCGREPASCYNHPLVRAIRAASTRFAAPNFEIASDK